MKFSKIFNLAVIFLILLSVLMGAVPVSADSNYSYYLPSSGGMSGGFSIPLAYETTKTITYIEGLDSQMSMPSDLFLSEDGYIFVVDKNNARVLKITKDGELVANYDGLYGEYDDETYNQKIAEIDEAYARGEFDETEYRHRKRVVDARKIRKMNQPGGVYVDSEGDIFIADTNNARILHLSPEGEYVEMFVEPESDTFDYEDHPFQPYKVYVNSVYNIYVINFADYHGFITLDANNTFLGYVAASKIDYDFWYNVQKFIYSKEVMEMIEARTTPPYFSNFVISKYDSLIYAVAENDKKDQIKKLTPAGNNVYPTGVYGSTGIDQSGKGTFASFKDIAVGNTGLVYAADGATMEIYIYDSEGSSVAVIGGQGNYKGTFGNISAIDIDSDSNLYVLDQEKNTIQVMEPTKFMQKVMEASALYSDGKYAEALSPWEEVLSMHNTYSLAVRGIAKAKYGELEYTEAMELYKLALDREGYSDAYYEYRLDYFREHFTVVVIIIILVVVAVILLIGYLRRLSAKVDLVYDYSKDKYGIKIFFHTLILVIFHPIDAFNKLKANRDRYKIWSIVVMIFAILAVRIAYIYLVHFPMSSQIPQYTDLLQEIIVYLLPLAAWAIVGFAITSISNGKTKFKETCVSVLFAFSPYILFTLPLGALSNILCTNEIGLYVGLQTIILLWCVALELLALMNLNEYSFKEMVTNTIKILFATVCIVLLVGMFYIIVDQFFIFIEEINMELVYMSRR